MMPWGGERTMLGPTAHEDTFARDNLPPMDLWPELLLDGFEYPEYLNAGVQLCDRLPHPEDGGGCQEQVDVSDGKLR